MISVAVTAAVVRVHHRLGLAQHLAQEGLAEYQAAVAAAVAGVVQQHLVLGVQEDVAKLGFGRIR